MLFTVKPPSANLHDNDKKGITMQLVPPSSLQFPMQYLEVCDALIRANHGDLAAFHQQCGFTTIDMMNPSGLMNGTQLLTAYTLVQQYCSPDRPAVLQILQHFPLTAHGMLGMLALASHTLGDALNAALEFFPLFMPAFAVKRIQDKKEVTLIFELVCDFAAQNHFFTELVMSVLYKIMPFTLSPLEGIKATFQHQLQYGASPYQDELHIAVEDQAKLNSIIIPKKLLDTPIITQSPTLQQMLHNTLRQRMLASDHLKPISQQVKQLIKIFLDENRIINGDLLAAALNMSRRTLTRRLTNEGTNLPQLQREVSIDYAQWLLLNSKRSLAVIAEKSGFSTLSNFSRAFKEMTGKTPSQYRKDS